MIRYSVALSPVTGPLRSNQRFLRYTYKDAAGNLTTSTRSVREGSLNVVVDVPGNDHRKVDMAMSVFYAERRVRGNVSADDPVPSRDITVEVLPDPITRAKHAVSPKPAKVVEKPEVKVSSRQPRKPRKAKQKQSPVVAVETEPAQPTVQTYFEQPMVDDTVETATE